MLQGTDFTIANPAAAASNPEATHTDRLHISQLGTLLRSKRKLEELSNVIQEQRRQAGH